MASRVVIKQEKVAYGAGPSNAATLEPPATDFEAIREVMYSDPIFSKTPKLLPPQNYNYSKIFMRC